MSVSIRLVSAASAFTLLAVCNANAASVTATINANSGLGQTIISDTTAGPSISRSALEQSDSFPNFASGEVFASLATGELKVQTDLARSQFIGASVSAGAAYSDTLTFSIDQAPGEFIEIGVRIQLTGEMFSSAAQGVRGFASLNSLLVSYEGGVGRDSFGGVREYGVFLTDDPSSATAADPDTFREVSRIGDVLFDNDDFGLLQGTIRLYGSAPTLDIDLGLSVSGATDFFNTTTFAFTDVPDGVTFTSDSGVFLTTVVPIPAAVWLFASALAMLGWQRTRQR